MTAAASTVPAPELAAVDDTLDVGGFTRFERTREGGALAESSLQLSGMHCAACAGIIEQALRSVEGVREARVSSAARRASVRWDPARTRASALIAAIRQAGYDAVPDTAAGARALRRQEGRRALWRVFVAGFCAMQVMMLATPAYVAGPGELAPDLRHLLNWGAWLLTLPVMWFSAGPFFGGAWRSLRQRRIGMDVPVALGIGVAFIASSGAAFDPGGVFGSEVYFDSLTMFISFLLLGRYAELKGRHRAAEALENALGQLPATAMRLRDDGSTEMVPVRALTVGDRVRVPLGQAFPADGLLIDGPTEADESLLSGESRPVRKLPGDLVVAGSVNLGAPVTLRLERVGADTRYESIVALMRDAMTQRPALARVADRVAGPFLWAVLLLAAGAGLAWQWIDPQRAIWVSVSVLIVTCPCALSLAAPSALIAAAGALAKRGLLLRRLDAIEALSHAQHLFIDKTGTLTEGQPLWRSLQALGPATGDAALLHKAASLARWSHHPLSRALCAAVPAESEVEVWQAVHEEAGCGVRALDADGIEWRLGSAAWLGVEKSGATEDTGLEAWFGPCGKPVARLVFDESLRPDAVTALRALRGQGLQLTLLSGDAPARVERLARRVGIFNVVSAASPEDKLAAVRGAQARGEVVAMVGDGVNDAPVLAQADVSFAMGQGALVARTHADAVIVSDRLGDIAAARTMARRCLRVVRQNLAWAALYNAACVPLALAGLLPPWAAGLGMALSSLLVVGNSLRLSR